MRLILLSHLSIAILAAGNVFLIWRQLHPKIKPENHSYDVKELLHDLSRGDALVRFTRVDPGDIFIRSPRDQ